jgi:alpha-tubulin suppressor-like RCC1 family protein
VTRVPARKRPRVVRTVPPKGATDVVLSTSALAIFSEPVDASTLTAESFQLQLNGQPVAGTLALTADGLRAEFIPDEPLHSGTTYLLVITTGVLDPEGDPLEEGVGARFTTEGRVVFASFSVGGWHSCATGVNGSTYCWGWGRYGQLGNGTTTESGRPVRVSGGHSFVSLSAAYYHTCGLTADGTAYCWGPNDRSELVADSSIGMSTTPLPVSGGLTFTSLAAGGAHTCGVTADGAAYCWGHNHDGQLGTLTSERCGDGLSMCSRRPVPVTGGLSFTSLAGGNRHTCGLTPDGYAYCWGHNRGGQLGNGEITSDMQPTPVPVLQNRSYTSISGGYYHTCALTASGLAYCWGENDYAQLGNGEQGGIVPQPVRVNTFEGFVALTTYYRHVCGLTADGDVFCWGNNISGELGVSPTATPEGWSAVPVRVEVP